MMMDLGQAVDVLHSYGITTEDKQSTIVLSAHVIEMQRQRIVELNAELDKACADYIKAVTPIDEVTGESMAGYWELVDN
jgi:hypothetical protein